jgi:4-carboxymuconolactone decarboxylase
MTSAQPQQSYGLSPRWSEITQELLFGEIWQRPILTPRERSIVVVSALIAQYRGDQLKRHIIRAFQNGLTKEELGEIFLQLAFYSGWPAIANATTMAEEAIQELEQT